MALSHLTIKNKFSLTDEAVFLYVLAYSITLSINYLKSGLISTLKLGVVFK